MRLGSVCRWFELNYAGNLEGDRANLEFRCGSGKVKIRNQIIR